MREDLLGGAFLGIALMNSLKFVVWMMDGYC